jgi:hypothetical protein
MWKKSVPLLLVAGLTGWTNESGKPDGVGTYCRQFQQVYEDVANRTIEPDSAARAFQSVMSGLRGAFGVGDSCVFSDSTYFVYPLKGHSPRYTIGARGRGYKDKGFDLFDMDVRGSHPAHDLFIRDKDKDNLDDESMLPVDVLAFSSGVVLSSETAWSEGSERRGGNYVWIYDPCLDGIFYYAHNSKVLVGAGQWVEAGDKIAEVGRTGFNAIKERSPTHLHLMFLKLSPDGLPQPQNTYSWLMDSYVKK